MMLHIINVIGNALEWLLWTLIICVPPTAFIFFSLVYIRRFPHMSKQHRIWLGAPILALGLIIFYVCFALSHPY
jgi:uncharacterized BrkB/YihY/UPF0761 family membrane protein